MFVSQFPVVHTLYRIYLWQKLGTVQQVALGVSKCLYARYETVANHE